MPEAYISQLLNDLLAFSSFGKGSMADLNSRLLDFINTFADLRQGIKRIEEFESVAYFIFKTIHRIMDIDDFDKKLNQINLSNIEKTNRVSYTEEQKNILNAWFECHKLNPFPDPQELEFLMEVTNLSQIQIKNWFKNARRRK